MQGLVQRRVRRVEQKAIMGDTLRRSIAESHGLRAKACLCHLSVDMALTHAGIKDTLRFMPRRV